MNKINIRMSKFDYDMSSMCFEIHVQGCTVQCPSCNSKESWNFKSGRKLPANKLLKKFNEYGIMINRVYITGGEPLQQDHGELIKLIELIKQFDKEIWLFTSYEIYQVPDNIKSMCDYVKTGIYDTTVARGEEKYGFKLATVNQKLFKNGVDY